VLIDEDRSVLEEVRGGRPQRYAVLVDRHKDRALTLAVRILRDRREAEEAVQDAFVRAYRSLDRFRGDARFTTWFTRILYNVCLSRLARRPDPGAADLLQGGNPEASMPEDDAPSALERMEDEELQAEVRRAVEALPEKFRTVITLFYVQEMKYEEIAMVLEVPVGTVKTHLFRARDLLRRRLADRRREEVGV
jgi:RNA polymerase sigma-70 factor (ECF subfamily)